MIAGVDLIRKKDRKSAYAMTCTLLTNSEGQKMGKTAKGALWLDPNKTSPFEFYQYWRNISDVDVEKCLSLLTFVPMDEVKKLSSLEGAAINEAKKVLAYEVTKIVHGEEEAEKAKTAAEALFGSGSDMSNVPTTEIGKEKLGTGIIDLLAELGIIKTKSDGRRLVQQNGLSINDKKVTDFNYPVTEDLFVDGELLIRQGKKKYNRIVVK
jgi:tyrosyl-tRNA synthetase